MPPSCLRYYPAVTESVALVLVGILVAFSVLRVVVPRRVNVVRDPNGAFKLQRPLGHRLLELTRLGFWTVLLMIFVIASWWAEFLLGILVGGVAVLILVWRAVDRIRRSAIVIDRSTDEVRDGDQREGRASDVQAVVLQRNRRNALALRFQAAGEPERWWLIPGSDPTTAETLGRAIADYLRVPLDERS